MKQVLNQVGVGQQLVEELQDALYDQLPQYTKGMSFESCRKAFAQGKKKTAENVQRARNLVSRPEIAESLKTSRIQRYRRI